MARNPRRSQRPDHRPEGRSILSATQEAYGRDLNVLRALANHPDALLGFAGTAYSGNSFTPAERELAYLGASVANDCHY